MGSKNMIRKSCLSLLPLTLSVAALAQQDFSNVEIKTTPVAGKVYMLEGRGGNIGVSVGSDGVLIVDDQFAPLADKIKAALGKLGSDKPRFILNTHWHGDHTGGNPQFGPDGTIVAHTNVRKRLATRQELFGRPVEPLPKEGLPIITFDESLSIHFNDEEIRAFHLPNGHTDGDIVILFTKSNVMHMGDLFFSGTFPFVDLDHGGDVEGYARNVARMIAEIRPDMKIIPGHGPLSTLDDLKKFHQMLAESITTVKTRIAAGKTVEQIKADGLPEPWKTWGDGFIKTDQWLETVHKSLTRKP
jgi:glyoxylase-like metal-dependent hydrolase (beta-lactamase superfamily II)